MLILVPHDVIMNHFIAQLFSMEYCCMGFNTRHFLSRANSLSALSYT